MKKYMKTIVIMLTIAIAFTSMPMIQVKADSIQDAAAVMETVGDTNDGTGDGTHEGKDVISIENMSVEFTKYTASYEDFYSDEEEMINGYTYTGKVIKPTVAVYYDGVKLKTSDYSVSYKNNINAVKGYFNVGKRFGYDKDENETMPAVVITGKGKYAGLILEENFIIFPKLLNKDGYDLTIAAKSLVTNMEVADEDRDIPTPVIKYGKTVLKNGIDYDLMISRFTDQDNREEVLEDELYNIPAGYYGNGTLCFKLKGNYSNGFDIDGEKNTNIGTITVSAKEIKSLTMATVSLGSNAKKVKMQRIGVGKDTYEVPFGVYDAATKKHYLVKNGEVTDTEVKAADVCEVFIKNADKTKTYLVYGRDFKIVRRNTDIDTKVYKNVTPVFDVIGMGEYTGNIRGIVVSPQRTAINIKQVVWENFVPSTEYDGKAFIQIFDEYEEVYGFSMDGVEFQEYRDFSVSYKNNAKAGKASVTITMLPQSGYKGNFTKNFEIRKYDINQADIDIEINTLYFNKKPVLTVTGTYADYHTLTKKDFTSSIKKNKKTMMWDVTIKGKGNLCGEIKKQFPIVPTQITEDMLAIENDESIIIGRKELVITIKKNLNTSYKNGEYVAEDVTLIPNVDYTVSYTPNAKLGVMVVTITGKGNFAGKFTKTYPMENPTISESMFEVEECVEYDPTGAKANVVGTYKGLTLKKDVDYTLTYSNHKAVGTATVSIKGKGNFSGTAKINYRVKGVDFSECNVEVGRAYYDKSKTTVKPTVTVTYKGAVMKENTDYKLTYQNNEISNYQYGNTSEGIGTVTVSPMGRFEGEGVTHNISCYYKKISTSDTYAIIKKGTNLYTGSQVKPVIFDTFHNEHNGTIVNLVENRDFVVKNYGTNIAAGNYTGTITIEGANIYGGTATIKFDILQNENSIFTNIEDGKTAVIKNAINYINEYRAKAGVEPLVIDEGMEQIARARAMIFVDEYKNGNPHENMVTIRENLTFADYSVSTKDLVDGWYKSEGHKNALLDNSVKYMGCAVYKKNGKYYYCFVATPSVKQKTDISSIDFSNMTMIFNDKASGTEYWVKTAKYEKYLGMDIDLKDSFYDDPSFIDSLIRNGSIIVVVR